MHNFACVDDVWYNSKRSTIPLSKHKLNAKDAFIKSRGHNCQKKDVEEDVFLRVEQVQKIIRITTAFFVH